MYVPVHLRFAAGYTRQEREQGPMRGRGDREEFVRGNSEFGQGNAESQHRRVCQNLGSCGQPVVTIGVHHRDRRSPRAHDVEESVGLRTADVRHCDDGPTAWPERRTEHGVESEELPFSAGVGDCCVHPRFDRQCVHNESTGCSKAR